MGLISSSAITSVAPQLFRPEHAAGQLYISTMILAPVVQCVVSLLMFVALAGYSAAAQSPVSPLPPELTYRIETILFNKTGLPSGTSISFGERTADRMQGFDKLTVTYKTLDGASGTIPLLISRDNRTLAQFTEYDLVGDPQSGFSPSEGPARGGGPEAPVLIVLYDDLECPYCAHLNAELLPTILSRYSDKVRVVYRSFPLAGHQWAMHAAIDVECLAAQNVRAYLDAVDSIHSESHNLSGPKVSSVIDETVMRIGGEHQVDMQMLQECIRVQSAASINASIAQGQQRGVSSTPTLFINGLKVEGIIPSQSLSKIIDDALRASRQSTVTVGSTVTNKIGSAH